MTTSAALNWKPANQVLLDELNRRIAEPGSAITVSNILRTAQVFLELFASNKAQQPTTEQVLERLKQKYPSFSLEGERSKWDNYLSQIVEALGSSDPKQAVLNLRGRQH